MLSNITLSQIYYFLQVIESGSISRAADNLNITQSTLSKSVIALEQNLNMQLFIRNRKRLLPTEAGLYLYDNWKSLTEKLERTIDDVRWINNSTTEYLRIGTLDSHNPEGYLIDYLDAFSRKYPKYHISIESYSHSDLAKRLMAKELDIVFTVKYELDSEYYAPFNKKQIRACPLEACMRPTNTLAKKESIKMEDIACCNLIVVSRAQVPSYNRLIQMLCDTNNLHPKIQYSTINANSLIFNLRHDQDIFICDRFYRDYNSEKLLFKPIEGTESGVAMIWREDENVPAIKDFISFVQ